MNRSLFMETDMRNCSGFMFDSGAVRDEGVKQGGRRRGGGGERLGMGADATSGP